MSSEHTPGPWETLPAARSNLIHIETSLDHSAICSLPKSQEANARRIVACVNACEGISTEALEREPGSLGLDRDKIRAERDLLRSHNAELVEEVKSLRAFKRGVDEALNSGDGAYRP